MTLGSVDARSEQKHLQSHAQNLALTSVCRGLITRHSQRHPGIAAALLARCGGRDTPRPPLSDFPQSVVYEAAADVSMQEGVLLVLLASARAEAGAAGESGVRAVAAMGSGLMRWPLT